MEHKNAAGHAATKVVSCHNNGYHVLRVRYPWATTEDTTQAYTQFAVKGHVEENAHHREDARGILQQIGKAKDGC